jgi:hypothetical protein
MSPLRILVTGSRNWTDRVTIGNAVQKAVLDLPWDGISEHVTVVHGGARGADTYADVVARIFGFHVEAHPADWERYGKRAGFVRNAEMVNLGADVCLAFPLGESRGTRRCMREAEKAGITVVVHEGAPA